MPPLKSCKECEVIFDPPHTAPVGTLRPTDSIICITLLSTSLDHCHQNEPHFPQCSSLTYLPSANYLLIFPVIPQETWATGNNFLTNSTSSQNHHCNGLRGYQTNFQVRIQQFSTTLLLQTLESDCLGFQFQFKHLLVM